MSQDYFPYLLGKWLFSFCYWTSTGTRDVWYSQIILPLSETNNLLHINMKYKTKRILKLPNETAVLMLI